MASYIQGYDEERFRTKIDRNFFCQICFNVLKDPVLCPTNQHCFCRSCITKHLENSRTCPTCADRLTVETLSVPPRMVRDFLNESKIRCVYVERGCEEVVQLQHLDRHEDACGYKPVACTNQGCGSIVNRRDLIHHESEVCEFRKLKCHSCGEMTKTLAEMEERIEDIEKNMARNATIEKHAADIKTDMEGKLEAVNKEVVGMKTALVKAFDEMKEVLITIEAKNTRSVVNKPSGDRENIIVAGGTNSVEMFNWGQRAWSPLQSLKKYRYGATSFVYNDQMTIAGGTYGSSDDDMIRMSIDPNPDPLTPWNTFPCKLPAKLRFHSSVLYNDQLIVTGGYGCGNRNVTSDLISEVQLVPPYAVKTLSRMPERRQNHSMEIFDDNVLIVGGRTSGGYRDNLSSVLLYDLKKNELKQLSPLPYEVSNMATVRWGDNIIVIGGDDKHDKTLNEVIIYNVKTEQSHMLPPMRCKRRGCTAVVIANHIVVLGGNGDQERLKSVECFSFETYAWEKPPEMSKARFWHTAVVV